MWKRPSTSFRRFSVEDRDKPSCSTHISGWDLGKKLSVAFQVTKKVQRSTSPQWKTKLKMRLPLTGSYGKQDVSFAFNICTELKHHFTPRAKTSTFWSDFQSKLRQYAVLAAGRKWEDFYTICVFPDFWKCLALVIYLRSTRYNLNQAILKHWCLAPSR